MVVSLIPSRPYIQRILVLFSNTIRCEESIQQEESELLPLVTSLLWEQRKQNLNQTFRCHFLSFLTKEIPFRLPLLVRFYNKRISLCHSIIPILLLQMPKQTLIQSPRARCLKACLYPYSSQLSLSFPSFIFLIGMKAQFFKESSAPFMVSGAISNRASPLSFFCSISYHRYFTPT